MILKNNYKLAKQTSEPVSRRVLLNKNKRELSMATEHVEDDTANDFHIESYLHSDEWRELLKEEFEKDYFKKINAILKDGYKKNLVRPPKELVFNALNSTSLSEIKCVILGQDPYHDDGQVKTERSSLFCYIFYKLNF